MDPHTRKEARRIFTEVGAIIEGHFVLASGKHCSTYLNKDALYAHPVYTRYMCEKLAYEFPNDDIQVVVAPAVGAVILGQWVAYHLSRRLGRDVLSVYADKQWGTGFVIKRGYEKLVPFRRALVVEDLFTTGGSAREIVELVRTLGGGVVGVAGLANRGGVTAKDVGGVPRLVCLVDFAIPAYDANQCPLCKADVSINTDVGHGKERAAS